MDDGLFTTMFDNGTCLFLLVFFVMLIFPAWHGLASGIYNGESERAARLALGRRQRVWRLEGTLDGYPMCIYFWDDESLAHVPQGKRIPTS